MTRRLDWLIENVSTNQNHSASSSALFYSNASHSEIIFLEYFHVTTRASRLGNFIGYNFTERPWHFKTSVALHCNNLFNTQGPNIFSGLGTKVAIFCQKWLTVSYYPVEAEKRLEGGDSSTLSFINERNGLYRNRLQQETKNDRGFLIDELDSWIIQLHFRSFNRFFWWVCWSLDSAEDKKD